MATAINKYDLPISISINSEAADGYYIIDDQFNINSLNKSKFVLLQDYKAALQKLPLLYKHNIWKPTYILDLPTNPLKKSVLPRNFIVTYAGNTNLQLYAKYKNYQIVFLNHQQKIEKSQWSPNWRTTKNMKAIEDATCFLTVEQNISTPYELKYFSGLGIPIHSTYRHSYLKEGINCVIDDEIKDFKEYLKLRDSALYYETIINKSFEPSLKEILSGKGDNINIKSNMALEKSKRIIYLSPEKISRIKDSEYFYAADLITAIRKLASSDFSKAYIFDTKLIVSDADKVEMRSLLSQMGEKIKDIHICIDIKLPYLDGLNVISKTDGLKQNIL